MKVWVDQPTAQTRFNLCKTCPRFIPQTATCKECGCFMKVKTKLSLAWCPLGKWHAVTEGSDH